jgi:hypothetical protein
VKNRPPRPGGFGKPAGTQLQVAACLVATIGARVRASHHLLASANLAESSIAARTLELSRSEPQHLSSLLRSCDLTIELVSDANDTLYRFGIVGELAAAAVVEIILKSNTGMSAH